MDNGGVIARRQARGTADRAGEVIGELAMAARIACEQMTEPALNAVRDTIERACRLQAKPGWARKAAAHAEIYPLLADMAGQTAAAGERAGEASLIRELMSAVGPVADGMITSSRRRLLAHLGAGDADAAALETEAHLRVLHYMWRLAQRPASGQRP
jgi:DNA-binding GntR family transcriptional regulator